MSKLRDEIARAVARAVDRAMDGERAMTPPPLGDWHPLVTDAVDDILDKVREALLRDEALGAAVSARVKYSGTATILEAALDAAFGEGGER